MTRPKRSLPPGSLMQCPECLSILYALVTPDGRLLAACTACKEAFGPPAAPAGQLKEPQG